MTENPGRKRLEQVERRLIVDLFEEQESTDGMIDKKYDCPICYTLLERAGRCETCPRCGWSTCSL
ncbi:MAG: hypothetical protein ACW99G_07910 [Candidatus Thorarchaeota archaeon]|jgi:rubrerythrin